MRIEEGAKVANPESFIRIRVRDPGQFESALWTSILKDSKPRVKAVMGRLKGTSKNEVQALLFPKEDGWSAVDAQKWVRENFQDKKDFEVDEVKSVDLKDLVEKDSDALYGSLARLIFKDSGGVHRKPFGSVQVKIADREAHEADIIISSDIVDRDKELVVPAGIVLSDSGRIPLVAGHGHGDLRKQIGSVMKAGPSGKIVTARAKYLAGKGNPEADWAWVLAQEGLGAYSIGFIPLEYEDADLSDERIAKAVRAGEMPIRKYTKWELVEVSQVIVPSNKMALQRLRDAGVVNQEQYAMVEKGMKDEPLDKEAEEDLMRLIAEFKAIRDEDVMRLFDGKEEKSMADPTDIKLTEEETKVALEAALAEKSKKAKEEADKKANKKDDEDLTDDEKAEVLAEAKRKKKEKSAQINKQDSLLERLAAGHVERINTALISIGKGSDVLRTMVAEAAGPGGETGKPNAPAMRDPSEVSAAGPGNQPKKDVDQVEIKGEVTVNAEALKKVLADWATALVKDMNDLFELRLKEAGKSLALDPESAAFVKVPDLISAVMTGVREQVDDRILKAIADPKSFRKGK